MSEGRSRVAGPKRPSLLDGVDLTAVPFVLELHDPIADLADRRRDHLGLDLLEGRLPWGGSIQRPEQRPGLGPRERPPCVEAADRGRPQVARVGGSRLRGPDFEVADPIAPPARS